MTEHRATHDASPAGVDVVLPCLDEAAALPIVPAGLPAGVRAVDVDGPDDAIAVAAAASCTDFARAVRALIDNRPARVLA